MQLEGTYTVQREAYGRTFLVDVFERATPKDNGTYNATARIVLSLSEHSSHTMQYGVEPIAERIFQSLDDISINTPIYDENANNLLYYVGVVNGTLELTSREYEQIIALDQEMKAEFQELSTLREVFEQRDVELKKASDISNAAYTALLDELKKRRPSRKAVKRLEEDYNTKEQGTREALHRFEEAGDTLKKLRVMVESKTAL